jgi:hypothetical protein
MEFFIAAFFGKRCQTLETRGFGAHLRERSTDLSTENVHNGKSPGRGMSYGDFVGNRIVWPFGPSNAVKSQVSFRTTDL